VEVDGGIHEQQGDYDIKRSEILESKNYHVIRFENADIFKDVNQVLIKLKETIEELGKDLPYPRPLP
jgi:very-short-patch-repair endonuclease